MNTWYPIREPWPETHFCVICKGSQTHLVVRRNFSGVFLMLQCRQCRHVRTVEV